MAADWVIVSNLCKVNVASLWKIADVGSNYCRKENFLLSAYFTASDVGKRPFSKKIAK